MNIRWEDGFSWTLEEWEEKIVALGEKKFRAGQIFSWLHREHASGFSEMTSLSRVLREKLQQDVPLSSVRCDLKQSSADGATKKYLMTLSDHEQIETVLMQYHYGYSLCISSQVGCRMGCRFCASTLSGKKRDLTPGEMLGQIYEVERLEQVTVSHIDIMGCGEPLDNYEALIRFLQLVHDERGKNLSLRGITVSTCGWTQAMHALSREMPQVTLAVSLHAPNDTIRRQLMPVAYQVSMEELLTACREIADLTHRRITFEYALVRGVNDGAEHAAELAGKLKGMLAHVNLIPMNPVAERGFQGSQPETVRTFLQILEKKGISATVRREMGRDIDAACGQLRRRYERSEHCDESDV